MDGRTDWRTLCVKIVITSCRYCGRLRGSIFRKRLSTPGLETSVVSSKLEIVYTSLRMPPAWLETRIFFAKNSKCPKFFLKLTFPKS